MKLSELIKVQEVKIQETDIVIKIKNEMSWMEFLEGQKITDESMKGIFVLTKLITAWNFTDDKGNTAPINEDNVKALPVKVALALMEKLNETFLSNTKKKMN